MTPEERAAWRQERYGRPQWWSLLGSSEVHWGQARDASDGRIYAACGGSFPQSHAMRGGSMLNPDFTMDSDGSSFDTSYTRHLNTVARCEACRAYRQDPHCCPPHETHSCRDDCDGMCGCC